MRLKERRSWPVSYGLAILAVLAVVAVKLLVGVLIYQVTAYLLLSLAVLVATILGGFGPGVLASLLGALFGNYFFLRPAGILTLFDPKHAVLAILFLGQGLAISAIAANLTAARRKSEEALEEIRSTEEKYYSIFEHAVEGIFQITRDGRILTANPAMARILAYETPEELIASVSDAGRQFWEDPKRLKECVRWVRERGSVSDFEATLRRKDGNVIHVSINARVLSYSADGELEAIEGTIEDITERKRAEEDRARLASLVESSEDAIIGKTLDGIITDWNRGAQRIYGYSSREAVGRHISMLIPPDRADEISIILARLRLGLKVDHYETVRVTKYGRRLNVSLSVSPIKDAEGNIVGGSAIARDITERKRIEEELERSEERFRAIFEQAAVGVAQVGLDGRLRRINRKLCKIVGYSREELLQKTFQDITHPDDLDTDLHHVGRLLAGEIQTYCLEKRYLRKDGSAVWINLTVSVVRKPSGEPDYFIAAVEDITGRKRAEQALEGLEEAERGRMARDLHDGPLQDIAYALKEAEIVRVLSQDEGLGSRATRAIEALRRAGRELRSAVYDLKLEEVQGQQLRQLLGSLVQLNRTMMPNCEIVLEIDEDLPALTDSTAADLLRIFRESLTNVRRHSGARWVRLTLAAEGDKLVAEVADDGRGFEPEKASGIGTTSMRERAGAMGGDIEVHSEPGKGTRVRFTALLSVLSAADSAA